MMEAIKLQSHNIPKDEKGSDSGEQRWCAQPSRRQRPNLIASGLILHRAYGVELLEDNERRAKSRARARARARARVRRRIEEEGEEGQR